MIWNNQIFFSYFARQGFGEESLGNNHEIYIDLFDFYFDFLHHITLKLQMPSSQRKVIELEDQIGDDDDYTVFHILLSLTIYYFQVESRLLYLRSIKNW